MATLSPENVPVWLKVCGYESLEHFRADYGLSTVGPLQESDLRAMSVRRCGVKSGQARTGPTKLHTNRPLVYVRDRLQNSALRDRFDEKLLFGLNLWSAVADIKFALTTKQNDAQIEVQVAKIDGPSNTLAYAYFPQGAAYRLPLVFDTMEAWEEPSGPDFEGTACHEGGHNIGLDHDPTAKGIMAAFYNPRIQVPTSPWEIEQIVSRYGKPTISVPPPVDPPTSVPKSRLVITGINLRIEEFK